MDPTPNQSSSLNHVHAITLPVTPHPRMVNKRPVNKNRLHLTSIESRKYTATISTYVRKDCDNRAIYSIFMVDTNCQNQNGDNKKRRERPTRQNSNESRCHNSNNLHRWLIYRE